MFKYYSIRIHCGSNFQRNFIEETMSNILKSTKNVFETLNKKNRFIIEDGKESKKNILNFLIKLIEDDLDNFDNLQMNTEIISLLEKCIIRINNLK